MTWLFRLYTLKAGSLPEPEQDETSWMLTDTNPNAV